MEITTTHVVFMLYEIMSKIQNKLKELVAVIRKLKAHIIFISLFPHYCTHKLAP